jgi:hypothetical protein
VLWELLASLLTWIEMPFLSTSAMFALWNHSLPSSVLAYHCRRGSASTSLLIQVDPVLRTIDHGDDGAAPPIEEGMETGIAHRWVALL